MLLNGRHQSRLFTQCWTRCLSAMSILCEGYGQDAQPTAELARASDLHRNDIQAVVLLMVDRGRVVPQEAERYLALL